MKNQLNKQAKTFLDSATRETQDAAREIQTRAQTEEKIFVKLAKIFGILIT